MFTISSSSNYLLREIKQSKKLSRLSAWDLIKETVSPAATVDFLCLCLQAKAYKCVCSQDRMSPVSDRFDIHNVAPDIINMLSRASSFRFMIYYSS